MSSTTNPRVQLIDSDGDALDDSAGRLRVTGGLGGGSINSYDEITVGIARAQLSTTTGPYGGLLEIIFQAQPGNSSYIMIGDVETTADSNGIRLNAGDMLVLPIAGTTIPYFISDEAGQKLNVTVIFA